MFVLCIAFWILAVLVYIDVKMSLSFDVTP